MIDLPRIFLANVGVNASHNGMGLKSPRFPDGSFEFVTIPERPALQKKVANLEQPDGLVRYRDLTCFNWPGQSLTDFLPFRTHHLLTHYDPEFAHFTYGDEAGRAGRAAALKALRPGDWLFFLARLTDYDLTSHKFLEGAGFYLIGFLEIEEPSWLTCAFLWLPLQSSFLSIMLIYGGRGRGPNFFMMVFIFSKAEARSRRFQHAYPIGHAQAELLFRDRNDQAWQWQAQRQRFTNDSLRALRTCRCVLDPQSNPAHVCRTQTWLELSHNLLEIN